MFGFGVLGSGASSSSSSSNLSPLAPPFTVDRSNSSKPNQNPTSLLNDSPYSLPVSQSWQYAHPSDSRSGFLSKDSTRTTSVPLAEENLVSQSANLSSPYWSTSQTLGANTSVDDFLYVSESMPYYPPYASPVGSNSTPLLAINEPSPDLLSASGVVPGSGSSQVDYTQSLAGLQYSIPHSSCVWNGLTDSRHAKKMEGSGNLSFDNANAGSSNLLKNQINQGAHVHQCGSKTQDDSGTFCGNFTERETRDGFLKMGQMTDNPYLVKEVDLYPSMFSASSELHLVGQLVEASEDYLNCQKRYNFYEKCIRPLNSHKCDDVPVPKSSTTVVIKPPTAGNVSSTKRAVSSKTGDSGRFASIQIDGLGSHDPLKGEEFRQPLSSIGKGVYLGSKQHNMHKDDDQSICNASWSLKENLTAQSHFNDALKQTFESSSRSHDTFTEVLDSIQAVRLTESFPDGLDQHNSNVDSPCWKGAPASRSSPFNVEAACPPQGNHNFHVEVSSSGTSHVLSESNVHNENGSGVHGMPVPSTDAGKVELEPQPPSSCKGSRDSCDLSNCRTLNFGDSVDAVLNMNDASEGCTVALHAVEKVLHSPSSQEDSEHAQVYGRLSYPKVDAQALVMAIHNLSELLRFHCSTDARTLKEQDHQALKYVISNLNACIPTKSGTMNTTQDKMLAMWNTVDKTEEDYHMDTGLTLPQLKGETASCLHGQPDNQHMPHYDEKTESFKLFPSSNNVNISKEDNVSRAILKILNENSHFEGEMNSQALLFKNLWLEAEAKLCSISYKARFDHMKIAMEMQNSTGVNESVAAAEEKISSFNFAPDFKADERSLRKSGVQSPSVSGTTSDIHGSVMARYNILKCRDGNSNPKFVDEQRDSDVVHTGFAESVKISSLQSSPGKNMYSPLAANAEDVSVPVASVQTTSISSYAHFNNDIESSVMARLNILKGRNGNSESYVGEEQYSDLAADAVCSQPNPRKPLRVKMPEEKILNTTTVPPFTRHSLGIHGIGSYATANGYGKESMNEFCFATANDPVQQTSRQNRVTMGSSTLYNTSSSDWEHVLKDDIAWQS